VSLEVSPFLALDTEGQTKQAAELGKKFDRKNVMIKIPGTKPGLQSIRSRSPKGSTLTLRFVRLQNVTKM